MPSNTVGQDPNAHLFYDVDWTRWLTARGFVATDIVSTSFAVPSPLVKTFAQLLIGGVARVWIKSVPRGTGEHVGTGPITMPKPDAGAPNVTDDFSFVLRSIER